MRDYQRRIYCSLQVTEIGLWLPHAAGPQMSSGHCNVDGLEDCLIRSKLLSMLYIRLKVLLLSAPLMLQPNTT